MFFEWLNDFVLSLQEICLFSFIYIEKEQDAVSTVNAKRNMIKRDKIKLDS